MESVNDVSNTSQLNSGNPVNKPTYSTEQTPFWKSYPGVTCIAILLIIVLLSILRYTNVISDNTLVYLLIANMFACPIVALVVYSVQSWRIINT
jgi:hypothetical protein